MNALSIECKLGSVTENWNWRPEIQYEVTCWFLLGILEGIYKF